MPFGPSYFFFISSLPAKAERVLVQKEDVQIVIEDCNMPDLTSLSVFICTKSSYSVIYAGKLGNGGDFHGLTKNP